MPEEPAPPMRWRQLRLFDPPTVTICVKITFDRERKTAHGGVDVFDFDTGEQIELTAQSFAYGHAGLRQALQQLSELASIHLRGGQPFPP